MSKDKIDCTCGKCSCTDLEEHKKNRQDETCKCECQDKDIDTATELETITVIGTPAPTRPTIIDWRQPETPIVPSYPLPPQVDWYDNIWTIINQLPKDIQTRIDKIGRKKVVRVLANPNKIEIVVVANGKTTTSIFGHVAIFIDNIEFGMSPNGWDIRTKETFLNRYNVKLHRAAISYEMNMSFVQKQMLVYVLLNTMKTVEPYHLTTNDCTMVTINLFSSLNINVVDPRYNKGFYTPSDVNLYLKNTTQSGKSHLYPAK